MKEIQEEAIETIEENLMTVFSMIFIEKYKEKLDCIFSELNGNNKVSDMLTEIITDTQEIFYNHGKETQKFLNGCFG